MTTENNNGDRRVNRSRQLLSKALTQLILEKRYDAITVQNIIDRAGVGRATFYAHYRDKDDLFRCDIEQFLKFFAQHFQWQNLESGRFVPLREIFSHVQDFHEFASALIKSRKMAFFNKTAIRGLSQIIEAKLTSTIAEDHVSLVPIPLLAHYLASEIINLLKWWIEHEMPYTPERMDEIFHVLAMPGFRAGLLR